MTQEVGPPVTRERRLADRLMRHAARVMPATQRHWALAMEHEASYLDDDRAALLWAIGSVRAAHVARLRGLRLLDVALVRVAGILLAALRAFDLIFPSLMTASYRLGALGAAQGLGLMTAGDDYRRLVPLMEAIPASVHVLSVAGSATYLAAIVLLLLRRRSASLVIIGGIGIDALLTWFGRSLGREVGIAAVPDPSFVAAWLLPFALPALLVAAAWTGSERDLGRPA